jgi:hypothetical protein
MDQLIESDEAGNKAQTAIDAQATTWDLTRKAYMDRGVGTDFRKRVGYENCDDGSLPIGLGGAETFSKAFWMRISTRRR